MTFQRYTILWSLLATLLLLPACSSSSDSTDGDADFATPDGDIEMEEDFSDGDADDDSDAERESSDEEEGFPADLFESVFWDAPDESEVLALLEKSAFWMEHSELITEMSSWFEENVYSTPGMEPDDPSLLGYRAAGNGRAFAFVGTWYPRNTLHGLLGPDYDHHEEGYFSDFTALPVVDGKTPPWASDRIWQLRDAQIVCTNTRFKRSALELDTVVFAPLSDEPGEERRTLVQRVVLRNGGADSVEAALAIRSHDDADGESANDLEQIRGGRKMRVRAVEDGFEVQAMGEDEYPALLSSSFTLAGGEERLFTIVYEFSRVEASFGAAFEAVKAAGADALLDETRLWWRTWHASGLQIRTPDRRANDLLDGLKGTVRVQIHENGSINVMSHYTGQWIRDSYAPIRTLLKFGYPEEALGIAEAYFTAASLRGGLGNRVNSDFDPEVSVPEVDWRANTPFGATRSKGEAPSYIPMMYTRYYRHTKDAKLVRNRWDYLIHALLGQAHRDDGLMLWSGDETFRPQFAFNIGLGLEYEWEFRTFSANSGFLFAAAAEELLDFAEKTDLDAEEDTTWLRETAARVRSGTEAYYWLETENRYSPFLYGSRAEETETPDHPGEPALAATVVGPDVNTKPLWLGYLPRDDEKARANILSSMDEALRDNGLLLNRSGESFLPGLGYDLAEGIMTGMTPGYFLYNVADLNLEVAARTFDTVGAWVSPSGNVNEVMLYATPRQALCPIYSPQSTIGELWSRFRGWEGAIVLESLMHYLIGYDVNVPEGWIALAPRLVHDTPYLEAENLRFLDAAIDMRYEKKETGALLTLNVPEEAVTAGLTEFRLRLTVSGSVNGARLDGNLLSSGDYETFEPFSGSTEVLLIVPARAGETRVEALFANEKR